VVHVQRSGAHWPVYVLVLYRNWWIQHEPHEGKDAKRVIQVANVTKLEVGEHSFEKGD
jgi:hypothetical protein